MIIEIRATGTQTVFPGSIHECGEPVTWDICGEPAQISFQELRVAVGKLAAASLLAEFWVDSKRHDLSLCVSGAAITAERSLFLLPNSLPICAEAITRNEFCPNSKASVF